MDHILVTTIPSWLTKPWVHLQMDKSVVQVIRHSEPTQAYVSLQMKLILCTSIIKGNHPVSTISNGHICGTAIPLCSANPLEHIWTQVLKFTFSMSTSRGRHNIFVQFAHKELEDYLYNNRVLQLFSSLAFHFIACHFQTAKEMVR